MIALFNFVFIAFVMSDKSLILLFRPFAMLLFIIFPFLQLSGAQLSWTIAACKFIHTTRIHRILWKVVLFDDFPVRKLIEENVLSSISMKSDEINCDNHRKWRFPPVFDDKASPELIEETKVFVYFDDFYHFRYLLFTWYFYLNHLIFNVKV